MLTETEVATRRRPPETAIADPYREYCMVGGILDEAAFTEARTAFQKREENPQKFTDATRHQVQDMADQFRFELTPEQTFLYCFLTERETPPILGDHKVFVETLLMTKDFKKYSKVTLVFFPDSFKQ